MPFNFRDLRKIPRGMSFDPQVNDLARKMITSNERLMEFEKETALSMIDRAEKGKWYGKCRNIDRTFEISFRHGVFQSAIIEIRDRSIIFEMSIINDNVLFGGKNG